jgi:hypothetical protein
LLKLDLSSAHGPSGRALQAENDDFEKLVVDRRGVRPTHATIKEKAD